MDCRSNSSAGSANLVSGRCSGPADAVSDVVAFVDAEYVIHRLNFTAFVNDPTEIMAYLMEATFQYRGINYQVMKPADPNRRVSTFV